MIHAPVMVKFAYLEDTISVDSRCAAATPTGGPGAAHSILWEVQRILRPKATIAASGMARPRATTTTASAGKFS